MTLLATNAQIVNHKDAELLARAAKLPFAAIGSVSPTALGTMRVRLGLGRPVGELTSQVPINEIVGLVKRLAAASAGTERDRADPEIRLETVDGSDRTVAWLTSPRCLVASLYPLQRATPYVALVRDTAGPFPRWQRELARLALMQESERVGGEAQGRMSWEGGVLESVLNRLTIAIALVERNGAIAYCNEAARRWFGSSRILNLSEGRVVSSDSEINKRLYLAIRAATGEQARKSHMLLLPGDPNGSRVPTRAIVVTPVSAPDGVALLVCADGQRDGTMMNMMLSELGLTPTERRLTSRLIGGECLDDAAEKINVKVSTARSYLRTIFDKTGASRQSQLVGLALSLMPPASLVEGATVDLVTARQGASDVELHRSRPAEVVQRGRAS